MMNTHTQTLECVFCRPLNDYEKASQASFDRNNNSVLQKGIFAKEFMQDNYPQFYKYKFKSNLFSTI